MKLSKDQHLSRSFHEDDLQRNSPHESPPMTREKKIAPPIPKRPVYSRAYMTLIIQKMQKPETGIPALISPDSQFALVDTIDWLHDEGVEDAGLLAKKLIEWGDLVFVDPKHQIADFDNLTSNISVLVSLRTPDLLVSAPLTRSQSPQSPQSPRSSPMMSRSLSTRTLSGKISESNLGPSSPTTRKKSGSSPALVEDSIDIRIYKQQMIQKYEQQQLENKIILDAIKSQSKKPTKETCCRCNKEATSYCRECDIFVCANCCSILHVGKWEDHTLTPKANSNINVNVNAVSQPNPSPPQAQTAPTNNPATVPNKQFNLMRNNSISLTSYPEIIKLMLESEGGMKLKEKKGLLKTIKNVFRGVDMIDWMVSRLPVRARQDAVNLAQKLLDNKYFDGLSTAFNGIFKDDKQFYRFIFEANGSMEDQSSVSVEKVSLDDFEIYKVVGAGGFGKVVQVRHKNTNKIYAMKMIKKI
jgi:hypothetical protein